MANAPPRRPRRGAQGPGSRIRAYYGSGFAGTLRRPSSGSIGSSRARRSSRSAGRCARRGVRHRGTSPRPRGRLTPSGKPRDVAGRPLVHRTPAQADGRDQCLPYSLSRLSLILDIGERQVPPIGPDKTLAPSPVFSSDHHGRLPAPQHRGPSGETYRGIGLPERRGHTRFGRSRSAESSSRNSDRRAGMWGRVHGGRGPWPDEVARTDRIPAGGARAGRARSR